MSRIPKARSIQKFLSDDIIKAVLKQLDWKKNLLIVDEYKDIVKIDNITNTKFKINDGWISGEIIMDIIQKSPVFTFEKHKYRLWLSSLYRTGLTPKKAPSSKQEKNTLVVV